MTTYFADDGSTKEKMIKKIVDHCGWEFKVSKQLQAASEPTKNELALLGRLDPEGVFIT